MHETINEALKNRFYADRLIHEQVREIEKDVIANRLSPFAAAQLLLDRYFNVK
jgi:LAO/AO transport system kinase